MKARIGPGEEMHDIAASGRTGVSDFGVLVAGAGESFAEQATHRIETMIREYNCRIDGARAVHLGLIVLPYDAQRHGSIAGLISAAAIQEAEEAASEREPVRLAAPAR